MDLKAESMKLLEMIKLHAGLVDGIEFARWLMYEAGGARQCVDGECSHGSRDACLVYLLSKYENERRKGMVGTSSKNASCVGMIPVFRRSLRPA